MLLERAISLKTFNNDTICYMKNYKHNILFFGMAVALAGCMSVPTMWSLRSGLLSPT